MVVKNVGTRKVTLSEGSACILQASALAAPSHLRVNRMAALPARIAPIPAAWIQLFELLFGVGKMGVAGLRDSWRSGHERLFSGDSIDPALFGEFFVVGKAEAQEEFDGFVGGRGFGLVLGLRFALCFGFFGFCGYRFSGWRAVDSAFEFEEQLFVQAKGLFPSFEFMAGELGFFLVLAEVELHVNVRHGFSL